MSTASDERSIPPYIPFDMLTRFLAGLKSTAVPNRIDNTILPNTMSGTAKRQLVSALKFLELVNDEGLVDEKLRTLVTAYDNKDRWTEDGLQIFCDAYEKPSNGRQEERRQDRHDGDETIWYPLFFKGKPEGKIIVPRNLDKQDVAVLARTIELLKLYAEQGS